MAKTGKYDLNRIRDELRGILSRATQEEDPIAFKMNEMNNDLLNHLETRKILKTYPNREAYCKAFRKFEEYAIRLLKIPRGFHFELKNAFSKKANNL